jgi:hypothetical protein
VHPEALFEQPRPKLEISTRLEEESCVVSVQPLAKREGFTGLAPLAAGEHIIVSRAERGHLDAVLAEDRLERLHGSLDDKVSKRNTAGCATGCTSFLRK